MKSKIKNYLLNETDFYDAQDIEVMYEDFKEGCDQINGYFVFEGYFGAWDGKRLGGGVKTFLIDAVDSIRPDSDNYSEVYTDEKGVTWVENHHHDGTSKICIKQLTSKGVEWYENNKDKFSNKYVVEHLTKIKGYTKRINWGGVC